MDGPEEFRNELRKRIGAFEYNLKKKSDNPVHDIIGDKLLASNLEGLVSREKYEERVDEIAKLTKQVTDLQYQLKSIENSRSEQIRDLQAQLRKAESSRLAIEESEEEVKQMLIGILATQINIVRLNILNRLFYCLKFRYRKGMPNNSFNPTP